MQLLTINSNDILMLPSSCCIAIGDATMIDARGLSSAQKKAILGSLRNTTRLLSLTVSLTVSTPLWTLLYEHLTALCQTCRAACQTTFSCCQHQDVLLLGMPR